MYNSFFGFTENPFNLTPDPRYLFMSPSHKEAIEHMLYGINERKGFIVITGGIGTGKTTLCRTLLNHLGEDTRTALIFNSFISDMELLKSINQEFGIQMHPGDETKKDYIDALNQFLLDIFAKGGNAVLIIDEAQNLSREVLEQIRMLSNLETAKEKLIQIVLIGQPELQGVLAAPSLRQLNERVMVRYDLKTLSFRDISGYMEHRMIVAGGHGIVRFTKGAVRGIYTYSRGNPRRINNLCDRALLVSYAMGRYDVSEGIIKKSIKELAGGSSEAGWGLIWNSRLLYALLILVLIIAAGFTGWSYRARLSSDAPAENIKTVSENKNARIVDIEMKSEKSPLYTDGQKSLSILFSMFYNRFKAISNDFEESYPDLVSYNISPEYYVSLKKPFRVSMSTPVSPERYLVIKNTSDKGATAIDADGKERIIDRDFIINNWGGEVSWVYPMPKRTTTLVQGAGAPEVLELQKALNGVGYILKATGIYDQATFQEIMKFQKDFDLHVDGIAGPKTRALLYQMVM
jgi:type II secretory pathway predicted ATPase ExeA